MTEARPAETAAARHATTGVATLVARIESSPILACAAPRATASRVSSAPAGYDDTDIRILDWIVSHRRGQHVRLADLAA
jgi:hypothetical protein